MKLPCRLLLLVGLIVAGVDGQAHAGWLVGPSAGYQGFLGLAMTGPSRQIRLRFVAVILAVLVTRFVGSIMDLSEHGRMVLADVAHRIAFPHGIVSNRFARRDAAESAVINAASPNR